MSLKDAETSAGVETALTLLVQASRVSPPLREAVATVENEIRALRRALANEQRRYDELLAKVAPDLAAEFPRTGDHSCENCGKPMVEHDDMAYCWVLVPSAQIDGSSDA